MISAAALFLEKRFADSILGKSLNHLDSLGVPIQIFNSFWLLESTLGCLLEASA